MNQCICGAIAAGSTPTMAFAIASTIPESLMTPMKIPTENRVMVITIALVPYSLIFLFCCFAFGKFTISPMANATMKMEYSGTGRSRNNRTSITRVRTRLK